MKLASSKNPVAKLPKLRSDSPPSWPAFVEAVAEADRYWRAHTKRGEYPYSVLDETNSSWRQTIQMCRPLVCQDSWLKFTDDERHRVLGRTEYGLLGSLGGAGRANQTFRAQTPRARASLRRLRAAISPVIEADTWSEAADAASTALAKMCDERGVNIGVATRLLALARPDVCLSVNGGSRPQLVKML